MNPRTIGIVYDLAGSWQISGSVALARVANVENPAFLHGRKTSLNESESSAFQPVRSDVSYHIIFFQRAASIFTACSGVPPPVLSKSVNVVNAVCASVECGASGGAPSGE